MEIFIKIIQLFLIIIVLALIYYSINQYKLSKENPKTVLVLYDDDSVIDLKDSDNIYSNQITYYAYNYQVLSISIKETETIVELIINNQHNVIFCKKVIIR